MSAYAGGSTAAEKRVADSLQLNSGPFGNPVLIGDFNAQYSKNAWNIRLLASGISIPNASNINKAYANNTPEAIYGAYAEAAYDLLFTKYSGAKSLWAFGRFEYIDLNAKVPSNGINNSADVEKYFVGGITFKPVKGVAVKADYVRRITGDPNPALVITPFPQLVPYFKNNGFIDLGIAYNF